LKLLISQISRKHSVVLSTQFTERSEEVGHPYHEAVWMLQLLIEQKRTELRWVERILQDAEKRAPGAERPKIAAPA